jgi:hypothetical protein
MSGLSIEWRLLADDSSNNPDIKTKQNFFDTVTLHVGNRPGPLTEDIERKTMGVLKGTSGHHEHSAATDG